MSIGLRRGIVEEIVSKYEYKVRIVNYDLALSDPSKVLTSNLATATIMSLPGVEVSYNIGDRVIVGFNKDELSDPIILGSMVASNFPTSTDQITLPFIQSTIDNLTNTVNTLLSNNLYTHIKYSNDRGITLTSLYDYAKVKSVPDFINQVSILKDTDIKIDPNSSVIYWSIIDDNNTDITEDIIINTYLTAIGPSDTNLRNENGKIITTLKEKFNSKIINIPTRLKNFKELFLSFEIINIPELSNINKYHIVLTTDKHEIGSILGDWLGICITTDPTPPENPNQYSWTSFNETIEDFMDSLVSSLEPRIAALEDIIFGKINSNNERQSGLADAVVVSDNQIDIHGLNNKDISFNINKSIYIDNVNNNLTTEELRHSSPIKDTEFIERYGSDGHFTLFIRAK